MTSSPFIVLKYKCKVNPFKHAIRKQDTYSILFKLKAALLQLKTTFVSHLL